MPEKPPLRPEEVRRILRELAPLSEVRRIILVGGQAVAFWAAFFELKPRSSEREIFTSKDIDFEGAARSARRAGELLGGDVRIPTIDDHTPNTGMVLFKDSDGENREIDFLVAPYGLDGRDVRDTAVRLSVANPSGPDLPVWVMHPERCMESRVYNVVGLRQAGRIGIDQLRRSVICAKEFSRFLLDDESVPEGERIRAVLRLNERIYRKCLKDRAFRQVVFDHEIDPFDAVLTDDRLPERFHENSRNVSTKNATRRWSSSSPLAIDAAAPSANVSVPGPRKRRNRSPELCPEICPGLHRAQPISSD